MNHLIVIHDGTLTTTSIAIAEGTNRSHKNVLELIRKYHPDLEEFGKLAFETRVKNNSAFETPNSKSNAGRPTEIARLNERQSTFLLTLMRNTQIVLAFKKRLVKGFYELTEAQAKTNATPSYRGHSKASLPPPQYTMDQKILEAALDVYEPWIMRCQDRLTEMLLEFFEVKRVEDLPPTAENILNIRRVQMGAIARQQMNAVQTLEVIQQTDIMAQAINALEQLEPVFHTLRTDIVEVLPRPTMRPAPATMVTSQ